MTDEKQQPRSTPPGEWLERLIRTWAEVETRAYSPFHDLAFLLIQDPIAQHSLAFHIAGNWLQVESLEVETLVRAARALAEYVTDDNPGAREGDAWVGKLVDDTEAALAPFEKP